MSSVEAEAGTEWWLGSVAWVLTGREVEEKEVHAARQKQVRLAGSVEMGDPRRRSAGIHRSLLVKF